MDAKKKGLRRRLNKVDKAVLVVLLVLIVVLGVLSIMSRAGLMLINGGVYFNGAFIGIVVLLGWGCYALVRIIKTQSIRRIVGVLVALALFLLVTLGFSFISMFEGVSIPEKFDTVAHGNDELVILRSYDFDEERLALRKAQRLEKDPSSDPEDGIEDLGYHYYAYPKAMGIFYSTKVEMEGEVYIGQNSSAKLMIEWTDEKTAHLFVANPEVGDGGDLYLYY